MSKLAQWEKRELLRIYNGDRAKQRCLIVINLEAQKKSLTTVICGKINALQEEIKELNREKDVVVNKHCLGNLTPGKYPVCTGFVEHPDLQAFDSETDKEVSKILRGE